MGNRTPLWSICFAILAAFILSTSRPAAAFELHGFADVSYQHDIHDNVAPDENNGAFVIGPLDFYVAESLNPRVDVLAEFAIESGVVDLERLQIGYLFSDLLKVYAGRFHTSLGYWNTAYHHGTFLYTTIERPFFLQFEDDAGILPTHSVGLLLTGRQFLPSGELSYSAVVSNGSSVTVEDGANILDPNNESDPNHNKAVGLRVAFAPSGLSGWAVGASAMTNHVINSTPLVGPPTDIDVTQTIVGADVTHTQGPWELLAEYFLLRDKDKVGADTATNHMYYLQVGREFRGTVTPYARHEQMSFDENDPYLNVLGAADKRTNTMGVRVRLGEQSVLKFEGRFITDNGIDSHQEYGAQWAFAF
ncbi:MAG TPA: hypothetical protein VFN94_02635 [Nitrospiria bacterium]|nr:hypothetical protein [Nitrospiria bacterium]